MMWVCRVGKQGRLFNDVKNSGELFLSWDGYNMNFSGMNKPEIRKAVAEELKTNNRTTLSNYTTMIENFASNMQIGDYVIVPGDKEYNLIKIDSDYYYKADEKYHHFRKISVIKEHISKELFDQSTNYSLGAFRTVFKVKNEKAILKAIEDMETK